MGYTRDQIYQIYNTRMGALYTRLAREESDQTEKDRLALAKVQNDIAKASLSLSVLKGAKDIRENIVMRRLEQTYGDDGYIDAAGQLPKKYELRDPVEWGEFVPTMEDPLAPAKATGKAIGSFFDATVKTEGYEKFQAEGEAVEETAEETAEETLDEKVDRLHKEGGFQTGDIDVNEKGDIYRYGSKEEGYGWHLVDEEDKQKAIEMFPELDEKSALNKYYTEPPVDEAEGGKELEQFIKGEEDYLSDDPGAGDVVSGAPSEEFIESEYAAELEQWEKDLGIEEPIDVEIPEGTLEAIPLGDEPSYYETETAETLAALREEAGYAPVIADPDWGTYASPGEIAAEDKKLELLRDIEKPNSLYRSDPSASAIDYRNERIGKGQVAKVFGITMPEVTPEMEEALKEMEGVFDEEGNVIPEKKGILDIFKKKIGIAPDKVKADEIYASVGSTDVGLELADTETADALSVGDVAGGVVETATTAKGVFDLGRVLTDEGATDVEKGLATTKGVKGIADPIVTKGTNKLVEEAVKKVTLELGADAGTEAGKLAIKAAEKKAKEEALKTAGAKVAGGAGAILGGYQAYTGVKGAGEAWKEGDIDEAVLHGIGATGGALNMVGGGLIATGVGAPLGAILMGVGTAASLFSGVGLAVEGMVEAQNMKKDMPRQVFDTSSYVDRYRQGTYGR